MSPLGTRWKAATAGGERRGSLSTSMTGDSAPTSGSIPDRAGAQPALPTDAKTLAQRLLAGDRRALARAISLVENEDEVGREVVCSLYPHTGAAALVGLTGAPGVGKSTLVGSLIRHLRQSADARVGVVSVDPSSPFTQGALLGDRIRLSEHFLDPKVFIRSMGTRGHLGGLAEATLQAALLLDAFGKQEVFVETVGVGQSEIEIAQMADTVVLVLTPGLGDSVQALKAGIMEVPDIFVINKSDHPAARTLHQHLRSMLTLSRVEGWLPPIVETEAVGDVGIETLWERVLEHRSYMSEDGRLQERRRRNLEQHVFALASTRATSHLEAQVERDPRLRQLLDAMHRRELDPLSCTARLFEDVFQP